MMGCWHGGHPVIKVGWMACIFCLKGEMVKQERHDKVLEEYMLNVIQVHSCEVLVHEKAPCHAAKSVGNFSTEQNIKVLDWPSCCRP